MNFWLHSKNSVTQIRKVLLHLKRNLKDEEEQ